MWLNRQSHVIKIKWLRAAKITWYWLRQRVIIEGVRDGTTIDLKSKRLAAQ